MSTAFHFLYSLVLSLWIGGIFIFTFIETPVLFKSFPREMAGQIVGTLFPGYFSFNLLVSLLALLFYFLLVKGSGGSQHKLSLFLITAAVLVNLYVLFRLHPEIREVKQEMISAEEASGEARAQSRFRKLHALSATLNLLLLADGVTLLFFSRSLDR